MHIFLTGAHDAGKTFAINNIIDELIQLRDESNPLSIGGFRTFIGEDFEPMKSYVYMSPSDKEKGINEKDIIVALRDKTAMEFTPYPEVFDKDGVNLLSESYETDLIIMDELGFMESEAFEFQAKIFELLDGDIPILGAIKPDDSPFLDKVREHKNVNVLEINGENRNHICHDVAQQIQEHIKLSASVLKVKNLSFRYEESEQDAIKHINIDFVPGTINVILGPSGCGKTTLCRCLTGIIPNAFEGEMTGQVLLDNKDLSTEKLNHISTKVGLVMQEPDNQIVASTVEDDIAFGPENMMIPSHKIRDIVDDRIEEVALDGYELTSPNKLSGGEKQRTVIAGILALDPQIMVFDEPMSSLDEDNKIRLVNTIKTINKEGKTVIIVEHDFHRLSFAHNWILMKDGEVLDQGIPASINKKLLEEDLWQ